MFRLRRRMHAVWQHHRCCVLPIFSLCMAGHLKWPAIHSGWKKDQLLLKKVSSGEWIPHVTLFSPILSYIIKNASSQLTHGQLVGSTQRLANLQLALLWPAARIRYNAHLVMSDPSLRAGRHWRSTPRSPAWCTDARSAPTAHSGSTMYWYPV